LGVFKTLLILEIFYELKATINELSP
jgi:hypothetical protein